MSYFTSVIGDDEFKYTIFRDYLEEALGIISAYVEIRYT